MKCNQYLALEYSMAFWSLSGGKVYACGVSLWSTAEGVGWPGCAGRCAGASSKASANNSNSKQVPRAGLSIGSDYIAKRREPGPYTHRPSKSSSRSFDLATRYKFIDRNVTALLMSLWSTNS